MLTLSADGTTAQPLCGEINPSVNSLGYVRSLEVLYHLQLFKMPSPTIPFSLTDLT